MSTSFPVHGWTDEFSALKGASLSRSMNNDPPDIGTAPHLREVCRILTAISTRIRLSRTVPDQHPSVLPMPQAFNDTPVSNVLVDDADIDMIHYIAAPASNPPDSHNAADYNWTHTTYTYDYYQTTLSGCHAPGCSLVFSFRSEQC